MVDQSLVVMRSAFIRGTTRPGWPRSEVTDPGGDHMWLVLQGVPPFGSGMAKIRPIHRL